MGCARRGRLVIALVAVALVVAAACGAPEYRYVKNGQTRTYLKVPRSWAAFDHVELASAEAQVLRKAGQEPSTTDDAVERAVQWRVAFDASAKPSVDHVLRFSTEPVVDVRVRRLLPNERDKVNTASLRNLIVNYDELKSKAQEEDAGKSLTSPQSTRFRALAEQEIHRTKGMRGVRLVFQVRGSDGHNYTIDQTALIDGAPDRLYLLVIQAGDDEYQANRKLLDRIATSFTVKQERD